MGLESSKLNLGHTVLVLIFFWFTGFSNSDVFSKPIHSFSEKDRNRTLYKIPVFPLKKDMKVRDIQFITNKYVKYNRKYKNIPKGSYMNSSYTVRHGDTLFYISWITNNNFIDLAHRNNISFPYRLSVGQTLIVNNISGNHSSLLSKRIVHVANTLSRNNIKSLQSRRSRVISKTNENLKTEHNRILKKNNNTKIAILPSTTISTVNPLQLTVSSTSSISSISFWRWPTDGKIIENFSPLSGRNKGIDIAGNKGQPIIAAADGRIVYAGNALRGYGNLIIIKHNCNYLSAYAHNDAMLVRERQEVKAGQKIAVMGSTGTGSTRLHFEIRYKGKSVNPLQYLPQR